VAVDSGEITQLLHLWCSGDREAEDRLFRLLLPDLRRLAGHYLRHERTGHTLQPTALVNEAFIRLAAAKNVDWQDRGQLPFNSGSLWLRRIKGPWCSRLAAD
jgi:hypothetical protein